MTDRPIIFSEPMVLALLAGRKTQTRRLATSPLRRAQPGDRLYVRESIGFWSLGHDCEVHYCDGACFATGPNTGEIPDASLASYFRFADRASAAVDQSISVPSIHMPRWASRLTLIVEDVRVQPLHDIALDDELAEGAPIDANYRDTSSDDSGPPMVLIGCAQWITPRAWYHRLWENLHGADSWDANPDVVAITFRVVRGNIDRGEG